MRSFLARLFHRDLTFYAGDFELVSSDGVRFYVASYHLFSASTLFQAEALSSNPRKNTPPRIAFTNPTIESAPIIRLFLSLIADGRLPLPSDAAIAPTPAVYIKTIHSLVLFLRKHACTAHTRLLFIFLKEALRSRQITPLCLFVAGAAANDKEMCIHAVEVDIYKKAGVHEVLNSLRPGWIALDVFALIPPAWMWALCRTDEERGLVRPNFAKHLTEALTRGIGTMVADEGSVSTVVAVSGKD